MAGAGVIRSFRIVALLMVAISLLFIVNSYLSFALDWPGVTTLFSHYGWFGEAPGKSLAGGAFRQAWIQLILYFATFAAVVLYVLRTPNTTMQDNSNQMTALAAYLARAFFWGVLLVGIADTVISFLRVEGLLVQTVGEALANDLGKASFRGLFVHYPLVAIGFVIAFFSRSLGFHWLAFMIVLAEIQIVLARFIFSYEQAFMADLVRFWYGALFLFASAYTLVQEGHVRVDILYAGFSERGKAWTNALGSIFLGAPLCWIILTQGMWTKSNVITGPLLQFEVTQAGYGMYVKYLLAGFLLVFAVTMLIQFMGYFLKSTAVLLREPGAQPDTTEHAAV